MSAAPEDSANQEPESSGRQNLGPEYDRARERAEVLLNTWGTRLGSFAATVGSSVQKAAARAREEAEDIWAEARAQAQQAQQAAHKESQPPAP